MKQKQLKKYGIIVKTDGTIIGRSGKEITGEIDSYGYRRVNVAYYKNNKRIRKHKFVHRLVAKAFLNNYSKDLVVNHKDCNKLNNSLNNIEMTTVKENTNHAIKNGKCEHMKSNEQHRLVKYPDSLIKQIYRELEKVERYNNGNIKAGELQKIAKKLGISRYVIKNYSRKRKIRTYLSSATTIPEEEVDSSESKR